MEAARRAGEEREHWEVEERQRWQEEEQIRQAATGWREAEEAEAWKVEAEWRERLAQEKVVQQVAVAEEQWQSLTTGLSGLKLTIPAPASIACTASGSSTQSVGKRKATEEDPSVSQYISLVIFHSSLTFSVGRGFPCVIHAQLPASPV
jgi:hypothetical protein